MADSASPEWDPSYFGCSLSAGTTIQPQLRIQKEPASAGTVWQPAIDCGAGLQNVPKTLYSTNPLGYALGETEIYGYQTNPSPQVYVWPSMTDSHISNSWRAPGNTNFQSWGNYRCLIQVGAPPWQPIQAYGGYSTIPGASACNSNF